ncbi:MAG: polyphosphate kinase 1 [Anaerolineae bacterium]|jgi:polyphosphate kinase|nr:polyphosphate kinase 1 [Anaerolineae bacterium]
MPSDKPYDIDDPGNPVNIVNRELAKLEFQRRVLEEAFDESNPLLERVRFLSILGSNLDEFYMVRVGGLHLQVMQDVRALSSDGKEPAEQLAAIRPVAAALMQEAREYFEHTLMPLLEEEGIHLQSYESLTDKQKEAVGQYFDDIVFPVLTPLAFDPGHPFPHISNLSMNLAVSLIDQEGVERFARVKVPDAIGHLVPIKRSSGGVKKDGTAPPHHYFVWLHEVIVAHLSKLFEGMKIIEAHPFHVIRNADYDIQEIESDDLMETIEEEIRKRRFGPVVRLLVFDSMPDHMLDILQDNLKVNRRDIYRMNHQPLVLGSLSQIASIESRTLHFKRYIPREPDFIEKVVDGRRPSIFAAIRKGNIILHHPYDSFNPTINFLRKAARDPNVVAIKATLYRVGQKSPIVAALLEACRDYGKQVAVMVELKARFDEESNIEWARMLEQVGVHVTYGFVGLKTHTKLLMVVRNEGDVMRRYIHLGTGNYNHVTARLYEDIGMMTCDEIIGDDVSHLFNVITGYSTKTDYQKLLVAPGNLRRGIEDRIKREIKNQEKGKQGYIIFKCNALIDPPVIELLYKASQAGVRVILILRGESSLRPGIKGLSENIRVISILGRYLEHSRIYYFYNGGNEEVFMGSADLMDRNLNRRIETLFPVEDPDLIKYVRDQILRVYLRDNTKARLMKPDGSYHRLQPGKGEAPFSAQEHFMYHRELLERELADDDFEVD